MSTTFTIPLTTLPVGPINLGPATAADAESQLALSIDRTVAGGLNSLTATSTITVSVQQSNDGGATWLNLGGGELEGGVYLDKNSNEYLSSGIAVALQPGTSRQLRASVVVAGSSIAVAGTLTSS